MHTQLSLFQKARDLPNRHVTLAARAGESYMMQLLILALVACVCGYLYFVSLSILNVIANREAIGESDRLRSTVSALEGDYFTLSKEITPEVGYARGMVPATSSHFVRRTNGIASTLGASAH